MLLLPSVATLEAPLLTLGALAAMTAVASGTRRRPLALSVPIGLALLVAWDAVALNALSPGGWVRRETLVLVQVAPIAVWFAWRRRAVAADLRRGASRLRWSLRNLGIPGLLAVPVLALTALSAARYAPQNWDSMTYHLARVVHWLQNGSVLPYRTHIPRQVALGPGAEYLLLALQGISGSDAPAPFVQWGCFAIVIWSAPALARWAGAPRRLAPWFSTVAAGLPMGVLQASSTQNDLVASVAGIATVSALVPFLHPRRLRWGSLDVLLLGVVGAATFLVKLTGLLVVAPLLAVAVARASRWLVAGPGVARRRRAVALGLLAAGLVAGPQLCSSALAVKVGREAAYPLLGAWTDRLVNAVRGVAHHLPVSPEGARLLRIPAANVALWPDIVTRFHEDYAGNPLHLVLLLVLAALGAVRWRALSPSARRAVLGGLASWAIFHATLRENIWFSRLQTPLFLVLIPLLGGALRPAAFSRVGEAGKGSGPVARVRLSLAVVVLLAMPTLAYGVAVAVLNGTRPPLGQPWWTATREDSYYLLNPSARPAHDLALRIAADLKCGRIGLAVGGDAYDYPLSWRAVQAGMATRHVFFDGDERWPCVVVTERGTPPPVDGNPWLRVSNGVFVRPAAVRGR